jgi:hypothetical protein
MSAGRLLCPWPTQLVIPTTVLLEINHALDDGGHLLVRALGVGLPIRSLLWRAKFEARQVDVINTG